MSERTYHYEGRSVTTIGDVQRTRYNGVLCYCRAFRGDYTLAGEILQAQDQPDGSVRVWYRPTDPDFNSYAREIDRLGGWH